MDKDPDILIQSYIFNFSYINHALSCHRRFSRGPCRGCGLVTLSECTDRSEHIHQVKPSPYSTPKNRAFLSTFWPKNGQKWPKNPIFDPPPPKPPFWGQLQQLPPKTPFLGGGLSYARPRKNPNFHASFALQKGGCTRFSPPPQI